MRETRDDLVLAVVAVGEERIISDIDVTGVRPGADDLTQYREAAEAGIEHQNRRRGCHGAILADLRLPFSCLVRRSLGGVMVFG